MIRLIVNADDYGWDENRTKAILEAYRMGIITTTTAMVNMPWFEQSVEMARGTNLFQNIGLHLTLTEGFPLTDKIRRCPRFCDPDGSFNANFHRHVITRLHLSTEEQRAVAEEVEAQMLKYLAAKLPLFHLDSHHHAHTDWAVAKVVMPIAKRMGFRTVRRSRNMNVGHSLAKKVYKMWINQYLSGFVPFAVDEFGCVADFVQTVNQMPTVLSVEVMVHPLYRNGTELTMDGDLMDGNSGVRKMSEVADLWHAYKDKCFLSPLGGQ